MVEGTNGMLLRHRHRVKTDKDGKATVFIKDGSELRLFTDSELIVGAKKTVIPAGCGIDWYYYQEVSGVILLEKRIR